MSIDRERLARIRELHDRDPDGGMGYRSDGSYGGYDDACITCGTSDEYAVAWPCETRRLVDEVLATRTPGAPES